MPEHHEVEQVESDVEHYEEELQRGKLHGFLLEAEQAEGYCLYGIKRHYGCHHQQIVGVVSIAQCLTDGGGKQHHSTQEEQREGAHQCERRAEHGVGILVLLVGKAEEGGRM